jgi:predicted nucleic acid-binding protein
MKHVYVDASVFLRVVLDEPASLSEWDSLEDPLTSALTEVEGLRVIDRASRRPTHPRRRQLSETEAGSARTLLHRTLEMFRRLDLAPAILSRAGQLSGPLGTLDALHLASALAWQDQLGMPPVMATHDPELAAAAAAHGLPVMGASSR